MRNATRSRAQQANTLPARVGAFRIGDNVRHITQQAAPPAYAPAPRAAHIYARAAKVQGNLAVANGEWDEF